MLQNVGDANHHIIFVTSKQLCSLNQIVFRPDRFLFVGGIHHLPSRQFLHGENGEGVDKQTDDGVDDCNSAPTGSTTAHAVTAPSVMDWMSRLVAKANMKRQEPISTCSALFS